MTSDDSPSAQTATTEPYGARPLVGPAEFTASNGIEVWDVGEGDALLTFGHVDRADFARACDEYEAEMWGGPDELTKVGEVEQRMTKLTLHPQDGHSDYEWSITWRVSADHAQPITVRRP